MEETKEIKGTFDYTLLIKESTIEVVGIPTLETGLASILVALTTVQSAKQNVLNNLSKTKGKEINRMRDRIGKCNSAEIILQSLASDMAHVLKKELEFKEAQENETKNIIVPENPEPGPPLHSDGGQVEGGAEKVPADQKTEI